MKAKYKLTVERQDEGTQIYLNDKPYAYYPDGQNWDVAEQVEAYKKVFRAEAEYTNGR